MQNTAVHSALEAEITSLERLLVILHDEQSILIGAHIDRLADLLPLKSRLLAELETATAARRDALAAAGVPDHTTSISDWIAAAAPELKPRWEKLLALAQEAAHFNRSNGQLIQNREEAQRIFMSNLAKAEDSAYTATGRVINSSNRRPLDQV
jgi:flagellar biosynthesis/type III secretory pathway chaperone